MLRLFSLLLISLVIIPSSTMADVVDPYQQEVTKNFSQIQSDAKASKDTHPLSAFVKAMPKGGILHSHLAGAVYSSNILGYANQDADHPAWCVYPAQEFKIKIDEDCLANNGVLVSELAPNLYNQLLRSWSMLDYSLKPPEFGHDHFFGEFAKRGLLTSHPDYQGKMLADLMKQAYAEHINYLELMVKPDYSKNPNSSDGFAKKYLENFPPSPSFDDISDAISTLNAHDFSGKVVRDNVIQPIVKMVSDAQTVLRCKTPAASPACHVVVKFQYAAGRVHSLNAVFANLYAGSLASVLFPQYFVGINLVETEDNPASLSNYNVQMSMIKNLHDIVENVWGADVNISLHAGELTPHFVKDKSGGLNNLTFHIYNALVLADAKRIGHGVDVWSEIKAGHPVFQLMKDKNKLIEINLTSNEDILGVCDGEAYCTSPKNDRPYHHPFIDYLRSGVPLALSTDDQGILLADLNAEFYKASIRYPITYLDLKNMSRNSLAYSFLPGKQLWVNNYHGYPEWNYTHLVAQCANDNPYALTNKTSPSCATYLANNLKAKLEWELEKQFAGFESK